MVEVFFLLVVFFWGGGGCFVFVCLFTFSGVSGEIPVILQEMGGDAFGKLGDLPQANVPWV